MINDIESHLISRGVDPKETKVVVDRNSNIATFLIYNLSGKLIGYQQYNPNAPKKNISSAFSKEALRYFTYLSKTGSIPEVAVWGLETVNIYDDYVFVVEGIFDAVKVHNAGYSCVAVLTNNPLHLKDWFKALQKVAIIIEDNDDAGSQLGKLGVIRVKTPEPYKDLGEMPQHLVDEFLLKIVMQRLHT